ncbi:variant leucine-rich repeat-containing protein [Georgenia yuyongxinii]
MPGEDLARLAADPATPLTTLQAARDHPEVRPAIAANPSAYPALLDWLAMLGVPEVDAALADRAARDRATHDADAAPDATSVLSAHPAPAPGLPPSYPPRRATASRGREPGPGTTDRAEPPTMVLPATGGAAAAAPPVFPPDAPAAAPGAGGSPEPAARATAERPPGAATPTPPPARLPRWLLPAGLAVVAFILLAWAFGPSTGDGTGTARPSGGSGASAAPSDPAAAGAALAALAGTTSCDDAAADAQVFTAFGAAASTGDAWQDPASADVVMNALVGLQDACDPAYALAVNSALVDGDGTPAAVRDTLTTAGEWLAPVRPAPADAQQRSTFVSPTGNIACALGEATATCTITERAFADPPSCGPGPVTLVVGVGGDARPDCAAAAAAGGDGLAYGQSVTAGYLACLSEVDGVTCWSTLTGHGFTVARAGASAF